MGGRASVEAPLQPPSDFSLTSPAHSSSHSSSSSTSLCPIYPLPPVAHRFIGLLNFGNTCYCNAVLQALYNCTPFRMHLLHYYQTQRRTNRKENDSLLLALSALFYRMSTSTNPSKSSSPSSPPTPSSLSSSLSSVPVLSPLVFISKLRSLNPQFSTEQGHQDAQEFLLYIFDVMEQEEKKERKEKEERMKKERKKEEQEKKEKEEEEERKKKKKKKKNGKTATWTGRLSSAQTQTSQAGNSSANTNANTNANANANGSLVSTTTSLSSASVSTHPTSSVSFSSLLSPSTTSPPTATTTTASIVSPNSTSAFTTSSQLQSDLIQPIANQTVSSSPLSPPSASVSPVVSSPSSSSPPLLPSSSSSSRLLSSSSFSSSSPLSPSFIHRIFGGTLLNLTCCVRCLSLSSHSEPFLSLSLPLPTDNISLTHTLNCFSQRESLCGSDKYTCAECLTSKQEAFKWNQILKWPTILCCHLKRFQYLEKEQKLGKLGYRVVFPMELRVKEKKERGEKREKREEEKEKGGEGEEEGKGERDGGEEIEIEEDDEEESVLYELKSVVVHIGSGIRYGHYTCMVKTSRSFSPSTTDSSTATPPSSGQWYLYDDESISPLSEEEVKGCYGSLHSSGHQDGYLLFYSRVEKTNSKPAQVVAS